jgi:hypothetical protein
MITKYIYCFNKIPSTRNKVEPTNNKLKIYLMVLKIKKPNKNTVKI